MKRRLDKIIVARVPAPITLKKMRRLYNGDHISRWFTGLPSVIRKSRTASQNAIRFGYRAKSNLFK